MIEDVELKPMEQIRIVWNADARKIAQEFQLIQNWIVNTHLPTVAKFHFVCRSLKSCKKLKKSMKNSPEMFDSLELQYSINSQRSSRRTLKIQGSNFEQSKLWAQLENMNTENPIRYLNSEDLKKMSTETSQNIVASIATDNDYADTGEELKLCEIIENLLRKNREETSAFEDIQWDSVFWDPGWARPDKLTNYLNKIYSKDEKDESIFKLNEEVVDDSMNFGFNGFSFGYNNEDGKSVKIEDVKKQLSETNTEIKWTGDIFEVKTTKLFRINLSEMTSNATIATVDIQIKKYEAVYSIKVMVDNDFPEQNPTITPTLIQQRLTDRLNQLEQKVHANLSQLISTIQNSQMNISDQVGELEEKFEWTTKSFCLLKNGNCPLGFSINLR